MGVPPLSEEECLAAADALRKHNGNQASASDELGISRSTFQNRILIAAKRGLLGTQPILPGYILRKSTAQLDEDGKVLRQWVQQGPEPTDAETLPEGHIVKGLSSLVGADGRVIQQWIKTREGEVSPAFLAEIIREALAAYDGVAAPTPSPDATEADLATVYILADWHVGLLAWGKESGQDYDLKIAQELIRKSAHRLISATPKSGQAVILGLGDLLHADNYKNVTPASGNALDVDGRYPKALRVATDLVLYTVGLALQKHDSVLVRILPGNHDEQSAIAVSLALAMYYSKEPRVIVDDSPSRFWWWSWGAVLLGATHGDKAKMADLPLIMAARNPEAWGQSKFRHLYTGHIHQQTGIEKSGVTVESFQTPSAPDAWTHSMGFGAGRSMTAITHDKTAGEILRNKVSIV